MSIVSEYEERFEKALSIIGAMIVAQAKALCPVGKYSGGRVGGRLRGSITWATEKESSQVESPATTEDGIEPPKEKCVVRIGTNVKYAPYVELGTRFARAKPYLRPALEMTRDKIADVMRKTLRE